MERSKQGPSSKDPEESTNQGSCSLETDEEHGTAVDQDGKDEAAPRDQVFDNFTHPSSTSTPETWAALSRGRSCVKPPQRLRLSNSTRVLQKHSPEALHHTSSGDDRSSDLDSPLAGQTLPISSHGEAINWRSS
ncbi:hypothetical protein H4Q26_014906 [Puccinia striiformis f. sp. tritici PST-130]|nr:hypothetical protein H4Q26_014906 [Puccinia striiformis f. sp. tritici PST-130]